VAGGEATILPPPATEKSMADYSLRHAA